MIELLYEQTGTQVATFPADPRVQTPCFSTTILASAEELAAVGVLSKGFFTHCKADILIISGEQEDETCLLGNASKQARAGARARSRPMHGRKKLSEAEYWQFPVPNVTMPGCQDSLRG